ncbi:hypothetical protein HNY73_011008 [Argiope bruennichi]|uniref:Uncharacterized protein n=1 Tax=Argiope bruennichi TaxID=94029 RepID=A0A8T0F905_ARGBR|nr:hypothetical protein HNY73_011008 [Argiope bruennichi]
MAELQNFGMDYTTLNWYTIFILSLLAGMLLINILRHRYTYEDLTDKQLTPMNMSQQSDSADPEEVWESEDLYEQILSDTNMSQPCESANLEQCGSEDLSDQKLTDINMSQPCGYTNLEL